MITAIFYRIFHRLHRGYEKIFPEKRNGGHPAKTAPPHCFEKYSCPPQRKVFRLFRPVQMEHCSPDSVLRSRVERQCLDYYARRDDACIIEQLDSPEALLARDDAGERYELYLIELPSTAAAASLRAAAALR